MEERQSLFDGWRLGQYPPSIYDGRHKLVDCTEPRRIEQSVDSHGKSDVPCRDAISPKGQPRRFGHVGGMSAHPPTAARGIGAPKATPVEIIDKLNGEINAALADPNIQARLADLGGTPLAGLPADYAKLIADETEKWGKVVKFAGIKPE